jgi:hypothetical protein
MNKENKVLGTCGKVCTEPVREGKGNARAKSTVKSKQEKGWGLLVAAPAGSQRTATPTARGFYDICP